MNTTRQDQSFLKKLTVLYVEDDEETREQYCEFLRRPVGKLITASNGAEGLEAFIKYSPDIVVTDILMPVMDGLTMGYEIKGIDSSVPIIVVTAFEQTSYLMRSIDIGIDKYVTKPVNSYLLFECLLECAHRLRAEEQLKREHQHEMDALQLRHHSTVAKLAGGMAHDYNNLLQGLLGYAHQAKNRLEELGDNSNFITNFNECFVKANDLGNMLRLLSNDISENIKKESLLHILNSTIHDCLSGKQIAFEIEYPEEQPMLYFVASQIYQLFSSIIANAIEAMPSGGKLRVTAEVNEITEQDAMPLRFGKYLHIIFTDSGIGMPPEILSRIFDPYFSTKQRCSQKGMGLSLALCQTIVIKHGGNILAESEPGNGTVMHIWLPVSDED